MPDERLTDGDDTTAAGRPRWDREDHDPGAYVGHEAERGSASLPKDMRRDDERIAANSTQGTGAGRPDERGQPAKEPGGHRQGGRVTDDDVRQAGDSEA